MGLEMTYLEISANTKVVHIIGRLIPGGVERRTLELITHTSNSNFQHYVYLTSGLAGSLDTAYLAAGAKVIYSKITSVLFPFRLFWFLKSQNISAVHSNIGYASGYILLISKLAGVPIRVAHFQSDGSGNNSINFLRRIKYFVFKSLINSCATLIAGLTPENLAIMWSKGWRNDNRCAVLSIGIPVPRVVEVSIKPELQPFSDTTLVVHVGRGELPTKNRAKAIEIFGEYSKLNPSSNLVFIGRDGLTAGQAQENLLRWKSIAKDLGVANSVHFIGEKEDVMNYLLQADILLFTSSLEGLPGVVLESLAAGLPVVSSSLPGTEFISYYSRQISLLELSDSSQTWARKILSPNVKLPRETRIANMNDFSQSRFNINNVVERYVQVWVGTQIPQEV